MEESDAVSARADAALSAGDWATVAACHEILLRDAPGDVDYTLRLARAYRELGRLDDAVALLDQPALAANDKALRLLAGAYVAARDYRAARPLLDTLLAAAPDDLKLVKWKRLCEANLAPASTLPADLDEAQALFSAGRLDEAEALYAALAAQHPDAVRAHFRLGQIFTLQRRWAEAADALRRALAIDPGNAKIRKGLANALLQTGDADAAIALLEAVDEGARDADMAATLQHFRERVAAAAQAQQAKAAASEKKERAADPRLVAALDEAQQLFASEQLEEAEQAYLALLNQYPEEGRAYFRLGQIYTLQRRWADSVRPLRAGLALEPTNAKMRRGLAHALIKVGQAAEALAVLEMLDGEDADVDTLLLVQRCHARLRHWAEVDAVGTRLLAMMPADDPLRDSVERSGQGALVEVAIAGIESIAAEGDPEAVIAAYRELAERFPDSAIVWLNLGIALADAEIDAEAETALRRALELSPANMKIRRALTRILIKTSEEQDILRHVHDAISAGLSDFEGHRWLARFHAGRYDWPATLESGRDALAMNPKHASTRLLVIRTLMNMGRLVEALEEIDQLTALAARKVEALQLKADIFVRMARLDDAIDLYRAALRASPRHPLVSHRLSSALLLKGDIAGFHRFHEKRRKLRTFLDNNKEWPFRDWNGELEIGGKLLVWSEFGLGVGQNILHMTFLKPLAALGLDVVFEVEPRLVDLCRRSFPELTVVATDAELPAGITHHTPIGSLSRWFKPDLDSFATMKPYFVPDVAAVAAHRARLKQAAGEGQLLVGISWTSSNPFVGDVKSVQLEPLLDAIGLPGVALVNLQYGDHAHTIAAAEAGTGKRLIGSGIDNSNDLDGLAAVAAAMDLVVCIGHTTAHVAGAVGTPNFVLLPAAPFAHWLASGEQCIWYPASRLFRQAPIDEDWKAVLGLVGAAVRDFAAAHEADDWLATTLIRGLVPPQEAASLPPREVKDAIAAFIAQGAYRSALELMARLPAEEASTELALQRGDLLARIGDWDEARRLYASLKGDVGGDRELDMHMLSTSLAMYDLDAALSLARKLVVDEPALRLVIANILYRQGRHAEALSELRTISLEAPEREGLTTLLATVLLECGGADRASAYLAEQVAMKPRPADLTLLARSLSALGKHEEALATYARALALSPHDPAANYWQTRERIDQGLATLVPLAPLQGEVPDVTRHDFVLFFVADNAYFWEHALVLLGSIGRSSPRATCHLHVINPDGGVARAIDLVRSMIPGLKLSYSFEHVDLDGSGPIHVRTYYASVRFVRLGEVFERAPATYLCLDADCVVRHDLAARSSSLDITDVGIRMRYDERPHLTVAAGALVLRPTAAATKFIGKVREYIAQTLETGEAVWFLDQIVLSHVLRDLADEVQFGQLDMTYIDWFFHDDSFVWTGKGKRKSEDNRYMDAVSQYRYIQDNPEITALMPSRSIHETDS